MMNIICQNKVCICFDLLIVDVFETVLLRGAYFFLLDRAENKLQADLSSLCIQVSIFVYPVTSRNDNFTSINFNINDISNFP